MINQEPIAMQGASVQAVALAAGHVSNAPETPRAAQAGSPALQARLAQALSHRSQPLPFLLAAEQVGSHLITLPPAKARQRAAMLAFAAEERIAAPLDATVVAPGPIIATAGAPQLTFVVARRVIDACPQDAPRILPEILLIPRPATGWAVWRDGDRCVVRAADGTGFAAATTVLLLLWTRAGQPEILSYGMALPPEMRQTDRSAAVPPPDQPPRPSS
ncbi:type II secretion system protein GspL [Loktanella atrilutea]|nr:type II secretion system protein GspL [Loktanella atrilutea]